MRHVRHDRAELEESMAESHICQENLHADQHQALPQAHDLVDPIRSGSCHPAHKQKAPVYQRSGLAHLGQGDRMQPRLPRVHVRLALIVGPAHAMDFTTRAQQIFAQPS